MMDSLALYFHIPYCTKKCHYCSFYSKSCENTDSRDESQFIEVLLEELSRKISQLKVKTIPSIFIGGGTPSSLTDKNWQKLLIGISEVGKNYGIANQQEWTVEVNPESLSKIKLDIAKEAGVNRISMGVQSFNPETLKTLGRGAGPDEVHAALNLLSQYWDGRWSADLICEIPGQSIDDALTDWKMLRRYNPPHISLYTLSIEEGTVLEKKISQGLVPSEIDEDIWPALLSVIARDGWKRYEVSNFHRLDSIPSFHNLEYWTMKPYLGLGPGAASTLREGDNIIRRENPYDLSKYLKLRAVGIATHEILTPLDFFMDHLLMGLRLRDGFDVKVIKKVFGLEINRIIPGWLDKNEALGNIRMDDGFLKMTDAGELFLNALLVSALEEAELNIHMLKTSLNWY